MIEQSVREWLLASDPAIEWQTRRDLEGQTSGEVDRVRSRVAIEGWGASLLDAQQPNGGWSVVDQPTAFHETADGSAMWALDLLVDMGVDPDDDRVRASVARVRDTVRFYEGDQPFFTGEVEPCINGRVLRSGSYFGEPNRDLLERLLGEQLEDGGWNCDAPQSRRSSFHTTICVLEGLTEYQRTQGDSDRLQLATQRGQGYLLDRRMFRSLSTGEVIDPDWLTFSFPTHYHYDVLRGLDYLRSAGAAVDDRLEEAFAVVTSNRDDDGRWPLQNPHRDQPELDLGETEGGPSRWNTLRALRVLDWAAG
ncbi:MAG: hypothetical protein WAL25_02945 [Acidimicrobiia bacterium]